MDKHTLENTLNPSCSLRSLTLPISGFTFRCKDGLNGFAFSALK